MKARLHIPHILLTLLVLCLLVFCVVMLCRQSPDILPLDNKNTLSADTFRQNGLVLLRTDTTLYTLDKHGKLKNQIELPSADCLFVANGAYTLIGQKNNNTVTLYKNDTVIDSVSFDSTIHNIFLNKTGGFCVIGAQANYMSKITAFDKKCNPVFSYAHDTAFFLSAALADNMKSIAIAMTDYTGSSIQSELRVYDIQEDEPFILWNYPVKDEIIAGMTYHANGKLTLLTDKQLAHFQKDSTTVFVRDFSTRTLSFAEFRNENYFYLAYENGTATDFEVYNKKGQLTGTFTIADTVSDVSMAGKYLSLYSKDTFYRINHKGIVKKTFTADVLYSDMVLCDDTKTMVLITQENIVKESY